MIRALASLIGSLTRTLDHADLHCLARAEISLARKRRSTVCNCE